MKVLVNTSYGGFSLSHEAMMEYFRRKEVTVYPEEYHSMWRYYLEPVLLPAPKSSKNSYPPADRRVVYSYDDQLRTDPMMVQIVEEFGGRANGDCARLSVVEVPDDVQWQVEEYDGKEWVAEAHRTWR